MAPVVCQVTETCQYLIGQIEKRELHLALHIHLHQSPVELPALGKELDPSKLKLPPVSPGLLFHEILRTDQANSPPGT